MHRGKAQGSLDMNDVGCVKHEEMSICTYLQDILPDQCVICGIWKRMISMMNTRSWLDGTNGNDDL